ncbi:MAG: MFS transporter [Alphaproteobacteria bacterium]|nr:MFS transporter [Alphaproteobacteria bacterium]
METSPSDRLAAIFTNIGHTTTHMVTILYATAVLHLPQVFDLPYGEMLGLASVGLVLYGVAALPAGWLGDRWSQVGMMVMFFAGIGGSLFFIGMADTSTQLFIGLSLLGFFASIYHPVGIPWLIASARKQGMSLGINGLFGGFGGAIAPPFVGLMIDYFSWREAFILPGIASIAIGLILLVAWSRGYVGDIKKDRAAVAKPGAGTMKRAFLVLTVTMACSGFIYSGILNTMPKLFEGGLGTSFAGSYTEIGIYVGAVVGFSSISSLIGGWLADRYSPKNIYIVFWLLQIIPLFFVTAMFGTGLLTLIAFVLLASTGFVAAENMLVARYTPFKWRGIAYGAKFVLSIGIGGLTVELAGILYDAEGNFDLLYLLLGVAAILATLGALLLPGKGRPVQLSGLQGDPEAERL